MGQVLDNSMMVTLIEANALLSRQLEAKQKRIEHLEMILEQRQRETVKAYDPNKIAEMNNKVYLLWLEATPGTGFTYEEAAEAFFDKYRYRNPNVPQRVRDLRTAGLLWRGQEDPNTKKVTFYLKLTKGA